MNSRAEITDTYHWLVASGLLESDVFEQARTDATRADIPLVLYLVSRQMIDGFQLAEKAAGQFCLPLLDLDAVDPTLLPLACIDPDLVKNSHVLPLFRHNNSLFIAVSDPACEEYFADIQFQTGCKLELIVVEAQKLDLLIREVLKNPVTEKDNLGELSTLDYGTIQQDEEPQSTSEESEPGDETPVMRLVNRILRDAIQEGVSDIHIEPYENIARIRFRLDGALREVTRPTLGIARKIISRLKVMAQLDISEKRLPQDGRFRMTGQHGQTMDFRVNTAPTLWGEKTVLRILDHSLEKLELEELGFTPEQKEVYLNALRSSQGLILVTGPTGSGKSSSLYAGLKLLNTREKNIATVEDPVEIHLEGVNQLAINSSIGLDFASALRAFLRQDPDVIMVGEIRDTETAKIAIRAAQTGHLVITTLHTNNAVQALTRLSDMGISPYLVANSISLVIAQRLLRRLCNHCKNPVNLPAKSLLQEGFSENLLDSITLFAPQGCKKCHAGYRGRTGVYEAVAITKSISRVIMEGGNSIQIAELAARNGFNTLRESALEKAAQGLTSIAEVNRLT